MIPFSADVFFNFLAQYNAAIWPAQLVASFMALAAVRLVIWPLQNSGRIIAAILAFLWIWTGAVYHLNFFALINFWDLGFGVLFLLQGLLFLWSGVIRNRLDPAQKAPKAVSRAGLIALAAALVVYPLLAVGFGRGLAEIAWVGTSPTPTLLLTLGLLALTGGGRLWGLSIIPLFCCLTGSLFATLLPLPQDWILLPVAVGIAGVFVIRSKA